MTEGYEGVNKMKKYFIPKKVTVKIMENGYGKIMFETKKQNKEEWECRLTFLLITILGIIGIILLNTRVEQLGLVIK